MRNLGWLVMFGGLILTDGIPSSTFAAKIAVAVSPSLYEGPPSNPHDAAVSETE